LHKETKGKPVRIRCTKKEWSIMPERKKRTRQGWLLLGGKHTEPTAMTQALKTIKWMELSTKKGKNPVWALHESVRNEKGGAKTVQTGAGRRKEGGTIMAAATERRDRCDGHPKIVIMPSTCHPDLDGMMTILGSPENRQKAQAQQVMEPSVAHPCQKQTKTTLVTKENTLCLCCTNKKIALTL
jgi:hypothetical protein